MPSKANCSPENVAPLIRSFSLLTGLPPQEIQLKYGSSDIVEYAGDGVGKPCGGKPNRAMVAYNRRAKKSSRLNKFQNNTGIKYFQGFDPCSIVVTS